MGKHPAIPHKEIVDYILSGKTTQNAKAHFNFSGDNIANLRVWAAFRALGVARPRFQETRKCDFVDENISC